MEITKEKFESYELIRESGITNMIDIQNVVSLSGLEKEEVKFIMLNYSKLCEKYPGVRK